MVAVVVEPKNVLLVNAGKESSEEKIQSDLLCCCEYIGRDKNRYHLLQCCCDCEHFDNYFTRIITCRPISPRLRRAMLLTFQDRLRIPWRGGAKQISWQSIVPAITIPLIISISAINFYCTVLSLLTGSLILGYSYWRHTNQRTHQKRSQFYFLWLFWSGVYLIAFFEITVPMLELNPEENLALVILSTAAVWCFYKTKQRAQMNQVSQSRQGKDELPDITEVSAAEEKAEKELAANRNTLITMEEEVKGAANCSAEACNKSQPRICEICRKYTPPRTVHCHVCGACIMGLMHHSYWLDCCVGLWNYVVYMGGLALSILALLLGANLALTAVCHPVLIRRFMGLPLMLPDDCSEAYDDYEMALAFATSLYALIIATYALYTLLKQFVDLSRGDTAWERRSSGYAMRC